VKQNRNKHVSFQRPLTKLFYFSFTDSLRKTWWTQRGDRLYKRGYSRFAKEELSL